MKKHALLSLMFVVYFITLIVPNTTTIANTQQNRASRQVQVLNAVQIYADNSQGSPLSIQDASVKEISGEEFTKLVGAASHHYRYTTFPEVNLLNTSRKTIRSFVIVTKNSTEKKGYMFLKEGLSISPGSSYKVNSYQWVKAERSSVLRNGKFVNVMERPSIESEKSWMMGSSSDLKVVIGMVEFDDGSRWMIPPDANE